MRNEDEKGVYDEKKDKGFTRLLGDHIRRRLAETGIENFEKLSSILNEKGYIKP